jgi:hypothetical protein
LFKVSEINESVGFYLQKNMFLDRWRDGGMDGWFFGWRDVKAILRIAYGNQKLIFP